MEVTIIRSLKPLLPCAILAMAMTACGADTLKHEGAEYWIYRIDPKKEKLELFLGEVKGKPNTFLDLEKRLNQQGKQLKFAMNAGIFEPDFMSSGLHVSEANTIGELNLKDFKKSRPTDLTPNFT